MTFCTEEKYTTGTNTLEGKVGFRYIGGNRSCELKKAIVLAYAPRWPTLALLRIPPPTYVRSAGVRR